ncbi:MAG TPA: hypothetical protein VK571_00960 [Gemmatimonadaceae bacterium]|nr:hypothetical protein [Gemmatimonadaceae bacterium]
MSEPMNRDLILSEARVFISTSPSGSGTTHAKIEWRGYSAQAEAPGVNIAAAPAAVKEAGDKLMTIITDEFNNLQRVR